MNKMKTINSKLCKTLLKQIILLIQQKNLEFLRDVLDLMTIFLWTDKSIWFQKLRDLILIFGCIFVNFYNIITTNLILINWIIG